MAQVEVALGWEGRLAPALPFPAAVLGINSSILHNQASMIDVGRAQSSGRNSLARLAKA